MSIRLKDWMQFANKDALRKYWLNPKGIQAKKIYTLPQTQIEHDFQNFRMDLHRVGHDKNVDENVLTFKTDLSLTKPEIKQYLEKVYNQDITRINTLRTHGKIKRSMIGKRYRQNDEKKAYVFLKDTKIPEFYQKETYV